ncbi:hypothetical protein Krac_5482 [Ktedonobacter racemifer DSM 44963]|uniref:Uncharacterized protein n=1 Tax=Ktedonobacter racemifer DSM 44963 TaxID=485913 RepID=D6TW57_KTERA|nr:hypothetical protein Krac_5482 [Ktedonobacter racemifer DSM 44963]
MERICTIRKIKWLRKRYKRERTDLTTPFLPRKRETIIPWLKPLAEPKEGRRNSLTVQIRSIVPQKLTAKRGISASVSLSRRKLASRATFAARISKAVNLQKNDG